MTSIWNAATHAGLLNTTRLPVDTSSSSGPSYLTLADFLGIGPGTAPAFQFDQTISSPLYTGLFSPGSASTPPTISIQGTSGSAGLLLQSYPSTGIAAAIGPTHFYVKNGGVNIVDVSGSSFITTKVITSGNAGSTTGGLILAEAGGNSVTLQPASATAAYTLNFPAAVGSSGQSLIISSVTSGVATLAFSTISGGGGGTLGTSAAAASPQASGDATTGLFSDAASTVSVASGGVRSAIFNTITSGVNYVSITPSVAGSGATITTAGSDTNVNLLLTGKGTGSVVITNNANTTWTTTGTLTLNHNTSFVVQTTGSAKLTVTSGAVTASASTTLTASGPSSFVGTTLHGSGVSFPSRAVTGATTTATTDFSVWCNGTFTVTLHTPTTGQFMNIKNTGAGVITLSGTYDGASSTIAAGANAQMQWDTSGSTWRQL